MLITIMQLIASGAPANEIAIHVVCCLFAILISFSFHEFMHAYVATWLGDPTPGDMGRVTLNPLAHLDKTGTILLLTIGIGWGKPVVYNPRKLTRLKGKRAQSRMEIMVALAGVTGNFAIAFVSTIILAFLVAFGNQEVGVIFMLSKLCVYLITFSLMLLGFNLIPLPPLDGFRVVEHILPVKWKYMGWYRTFERYAPMGLMVLMLSSYFTGFSVLSVLVDIMKWPFQTVLDLLLNFLVDLLG